MMAGVNKGKRCNYISALVALLYLSLLSPVSTRPQTATAPRSPILPGPEPPDVPLEWKQLVGIYAKSAANIVVLERNGVLFMRFGDRPEEPLKYDEHSYRLILQTNPDSDLLVGRTAAGSVNYLIFQKEWPDDHKDHMDGALVFTRADAGADPEQFFHVSPSKPIEQLRAEALRVSSPAEAGPFRKPHLVELTSLDPGFHLDIRYAQSNNFLSTPVYTQARAFLQRPAAEALQRALKKLKPLGYGLLIHDAYRPWYVSKIFWDATPPADHNFVADPQKGSKHNRGCAVDLTLYDLATGQAIEMPGLYDEMSPRSFPTFPGGTSLQRWHRDLLRKAIESEGFTVDKNEWWHFDYQDWKQYAILNVPFEDLDKLAMPGGVNP
jgi:D-alanyl-D-alanine dipeptidase